MTRVCVIDLPGLSRELLSAVPANSALGKWLAGQRLLELTPSSPAVTCSMQATLTTGVPPAQHGIIANGLPTFRFPQDQALVDPSNFESYRKEISFWEQSNQFVEAPRFWQDTHGQSRFKTALLFFQHSMPGFAGIPKPAADIVLTPKPDHGPDGKLVSLCWSDPQEMVPQLFKELGPFPLMNYWGPMAGIVSSQWIAKAAEWVWQNHKPQLQLVYVPHLDYDLQRFGPHSSQATKAVVDLSAALEPLLDVVIGDGGKIVLVSEYAIQPVSRCIHPNRLLVEAGLLVTRPTSDGELIDYQRSAAFAMVDHQVAHIYTKTSRDIPAAMEVLNCGPRIWRTDDEHSHGMSWKHRRIGDFVLEAPADAWFDYRWWTDPGKAPAFAGMVDIHRKPGYDPLELFFDPVTKRIAQNEQLVRGSHGISSKGQAIIAGSFGSGQYAPLLATEVANLILSSMKS